MERKSQFGLGADFLKEGVEIPSVDTFLHVVSERAGFSPHVFFKGQEVFGWKELIDLGIGDNGAFLANGLELFFPVWVGRIWRGHGVKVPHRVKSAMDKFPVGKLP